MTYNFFNTSLLAFGKKLTSAFKSLNDLYKAAEDNVVQVLQDLRVFNQYGNKNYKIPIPTNGSRPCRTDELFNLIDQPVHFKRLQYSNGSFVIQGIWFNKGSKRITNFSGQTSILEGSAYFTEGLSNNTTGSTVKFYSKNSSDDRIGIRLFDYRIDNKTGIIYLKNPVSNLNYIPL